MTDARLIEWNATLDGIDTIRFDEEKDSDYYSRQRAKRCGLATRVELPNERERPVPQ